MAFGFTSSSNGLGVLLQPPGDAVIRRVAMAVIGMRTFLTGFGEMV